MAVVDEESRESITVCLNGDQETDSNNRRYKIGQEEHFVGVFSDSRERPVKRWQIGTR